MKSLASRKWFYPLVYLLHISLLALSLVALWLGRE
jgi:hypothetical protein